MSLGKCHQLQVADSRALLGRDVLLKLSCVAELMPWTWPHSHLSGSYELGNLLCIFIIPNWYFADKSPNSQSYGFSSSHVQMWEWDHKEVWALKNWHFRTVVLEKTLESLLGSKKIKPVKPKGNQTWIFIGRTDAEAEAPILWSPDMKSQVIRKDPDAGKDWRQEEKGATEKETAGWHHRLNGHEFEQTLGDSKG